MSVGTGPDGTKSSASSSAYFKLVIADNTALHARLTTWGKHLDMVLIASKVYKFRLTECADRPDENIYFVR
jgi:hypothetical protein